MKTILLLGQSNSPEVQSIAHKAQLANCHSIIFDSRYIPNSATIEYLPEYSSTHIIADGSRIPLSAINGVYWSRVDPPNYQIQEDDSDTALLNLESTCLLQLLLSDTNVKWVNSFEAVQFHRTKPRQLSLAKQLGALIPATYIGNRLSAIKAFLDVYPTAISKPIFAGDLTQLIHASSQTDESIRQWAKFPTTLQAYIPGQNVRTYIVGDFMISAIIQENYNNSSSAMVNTAQQTKTDLNEPNKTIPSESLASSKRQYADYRQADSVTLVPMQIPIQVQDLAVKIMRAFHMQFTAIDWRLTPQGQFVFLEANPAPLFVNAQKQMGVEIDQAIVSLLLD